MLSRSRTALCSLTLTLHHALSLTHCTMLSHSHCTMLSRSHTAPCFLAHTAPRFLAHTAPCFLALTLHHAFSLSHCTTQAGVHSCYVSPLRPFHRPGATKQYCKHQRGQYRSTWGRSMKVALKRSMRAPFTNLALYAGGRSFFFVFGILYADIRATFDGFMVGV